MDSAEDIRDQKLEQVTREPWSTIIYRWFQSTPMPATFIGEDIRNILLDAGAPSPHHSNAWGAFVNTLVRNQEITWTGSMRKPRDQKSHARACKVYRRLSVVTQVAHINNVEPIRRDGQQLNLF
jgi:hypothetical protein